MKTFHTKAVKYKTIGTDHKGNAYVAESVLAFDHRTDPKALIQSWNRSHIKYVMGEELDIKTAIHLKSKSGTTIANDCKLIDNLPFHSVELSCNTIQ